MAKWTGKRVTKLLLFKQINTELFWKIGYEHVIFFVLYLLSLYYCYRTIGEQYLEALTKAEEQNINIFDETEKLRNSAMSFLSGDASSGDDIVAEQSFKVPSKWLPGFWASISFGVTVILHILMVLGQRWSVAFRCLVRFRKVNNVQEATHVHVTPQKHQGKEELVEIIRTNNSIYFEFHRRKYVYDARNDTFVKVRCRINYPISHYLRWRGIPEEKIETQLKELHGPNKFQMSAPAFLDLYIEQITSPFTVFQIFCIVLWMLDDYWQYSLFTLFMICTFEATSVFSRLKSLSTLKGMGNEPRPIYAYRFNKWSEISTEELLPGDIFSLTKHSKDDVIPCDALLIRGGAVVNEATLTGESVPQMKDGISQGVNVTDSDVDLSVEVSIKGQHKVHALFGGTRILQVTSVAKRTAEFEEDKADEEELKALGNEETAPPQEASDSIAPEEDKAGEDEDDEAEETVDSVNLGGDITTPPDSGCLCYCTRTGFSSSQGKLVRMIEHSQASVRGDTRDTVLLLLLLLVFALSASGYVLYHGMQDGRRSKYQLLLHCILIVTSVIPPELPMQTALAVNASLMTLMKMQIFCTEPFRVPIAGKVDVCVFDKTGTLTTDELVAVGTVTPSIRAVELKRLHDEALVAIEKATKLARETPPPDAVPNPRQKNAPTPPPPPAVPSISAATAGMISINDTTPEVALVLGSCHSLVLVDGKVAGDPLEVASLRAIKWELPPNSADCARPKPEVAIERPMKISTLDSGSLPITQIKILARHHFNSKLQRMSVVMKMKGDSPGFAFVVVKGSPEALSQMCVDCPKDFHQVAADLAKRGMRVIALGMRRLSNSSEIQTCCESRAAAEQQLRFVGFVAFTCRVRKDTAICIQNLRMGGNTVIMATGDAMLTAVHVAQEVGITTTSKKGILILDSIDSRFQWTDYESGDKSSVPFTPDSISKVSDEYDLCVTGTTLSAAMEAYPSMAQVMDKFVVYARMRPDEKERVILNMKNNGKICLMCGDGANDVSKATSALPNSLTLVHLLTPLCCLGRCIETSSRRSRSVEWLWRSQCVKRKERSRSQGC
jgi:manganese-transporting P-type ATPase